ncbi:lipoprotein, putative (plasmid) [Aliivibrio fischeri MJ11]|uniref:Lipoprotein, putative n=1 Tax=Aliivibrio fischeri (strain MJ11) TaxID=388396 RepID=B5EW12_ALIFM|nr:hypothetical protein [Aliivibrio fischeri]ACH64800.1 lipoprotein, putative [Aliivibrio fischeri MJ11]
MKKGFLCLLPLSMLLFGCNDKDDTPEPIWETLRSCGFTFVNEDRTSFTYKCINYTSDLPSPTFVNSILLDEKVACKVTSSIAFVDDKPVDDISFDCDTNVVEFNPNNLFNKKWSCKGFDWFGGYSNSRTNVSTLTFDKDTFSLFLKAKPDSENMWFHMASVIKGTWEYKGNEFFVFKPNSITNPQISKTDKTLKDAPFPILSDDFKLMLKDHDELTLSGQYQVINATVSKNQWKDFSCEVKQGI